MFDWIFIALGLLFVKHWYVDFVNQTMEEVQYKGVYRDWRGIKHSLKQGVGTALVLALTGVFFLDAILLGLVDFILHYHIDWGKININKKFNYTVQDTKFWAWLGADQLAHSLTYLLIIWTLV